jgi:hypothetical protein
MSIPLPVLQFAELDSLDGLHPAKPIAWHEADDEWVIVYEDGRKLRHKNTEPHNAPLTGDRKKESITARKQARQD